MVEPSPRGVHNGGGQGRFAARTASYTVRRGTPVRTTTARIASLRVAPPASSAATAPASSAAGASPPPPGAPPGRRPGGAPPRPHLRRPGHDQRDLALHSIGGPGGELRQRAAAHLL